MIDYTGHRAILINKETDEQVEGVIIADPPKGETRFRIDDGCEVGAYEWFYAVRGH